MRSRHAAALSALAALSIAPGIASGHARRAPQRMPLLTIAQLGSLSWSCDGRGGGGTVWFRSSPASASEVVRIASGPSHKTASLLRVGDAVSLRVGPTQKVHIEIRQFTEARELHASISLSFPGARVRSACWPYFPPIVALSLHY